MIKALAPVDGFGDFYYNKCSYDPLEIFITADLHNLTITDSKSKTVVWYDYDADPKHVHVNTKEFPNKTYNYSDVFQITDYKVSGDMLGISDYWTEDPVSHEFIGGKTLKVYHELLKKLDFGDYTIYSRPSRTTIDRWTRSPTNVASKLPISSCLSFPALPWRTA